MTDWDWKIGAMTLFVPDLDGAVEWYRNAFDIDVQAMDESTAMVRFTNMFVFLHKASAAPESLPEVLEEARKGAGQFAIIVADVDGVAAGLASRGIALLSGPADRPWDMRTVTFTDPAGHIWEIAQPISNDAA
ncbi:MAG: VOC family protein [Actinobacteria bacterium]|nr:VOC family protein [Actinomycetota bacterium]MBO0834354.1 VOC family protein [Actinomycetota bacterium]